MVENSTANFNSDGLNLGDSAAVNCTVNISGAGDISSNTNSSHPWANFSY
jgi:hypothetical protein